jgi:hypothetical protein
MVVRVGVKEIVRQSPIHGQKISRVCFSQVDGLTSHIMSAPVGRGWNQLYLTPVAPTSTGDLATVTTRLITRRICLVINISHACSSCSHIIAERKLHHEGSRYIISAGKRDRRLSVKQLVISRGLPLCHSIGRD